MFEQSDIHGDGARDVRDTSSDSLSSSTLTSEQEALSDWRIDSGSFMEADDEENMDIGDDVVNGEEVRNTSADEEVTEITEACSVLQRDAASDPIGIPRPSAPVPEECVCIMDRDDCQVNGTCHECKLHCPYVFPPILHGEPVIHRAHTAPDGLDAIDTEHLLQNGHDEHQEGRHSFLPSTKEMFEI